jgi:hypothetical protein
MLGSSTLSAKWIMSNVVSLPAAVPQPAAAAPHPPVQPRVRLICPHPACPLPAPVPATARERALLDAFRRLDGIQARTVLELAERLARPADPPAGMR